MRNAFLPTNLNLAPLISEAAFISTFAAPFVDLERAKIFWALIIQQRAWALITQLKISGQAFKPEIFQDGLPIATHVELRKKARS